MNILILSNKLPYPPKDGGAIATLNLALGLTEAGCQVTLLALNTKKHFFPPGNIPSAILRKIRIHSVYADTGIRIHRMISNLLFSRVPYIASRFFKEAYLEKLTAILENEQFDLIQLEGPYMSLYMERIRILSRAPVSFRAHNVEYEIWKRRVASSKNIIHKLYLGNMARRIRMMEQTLVKQSDLLVAISERDRQALLTGAEDIPSVTIPTGIDSSVYSPGQTVSEQSVFYIGSLDWLPNQEGLLWLRKYVIPRVIRELPGTTFHFAGRNASDDFLKKMEHPSVIYHGEVDDARGFMARHQVMAVPLFTGSGIRIKIIEAMAMEKGIVTTPVGAEGLGVTDGEQLFISSDPSGFSQHIISLLNDSALYKTLSGNAKRYVNKNFDTFAVSKQLQEFYQAHI